MDPDLQMKPSDFFSLTFQEQVEYISQKIIWGEPLSHLWVSKMWRVMLIGNNLLGNNVFFGPITGLSVISMCIRL